VFRTERSVFDLRELQAKTKVSTTVIQDLLFADDYALGAHYEDDLQVLLDLFVQASCRFGLTASLKKMEVLYQPTSSSTHPSPSIMITCP